MDVVRALTDGVAYQSTVGDIKAWPRSDITIHPNRTVNDEEPERWQYNERGWLTEKDERRIRDGGSHSHYYHYDNRHRPAHYVRAQQGQSLLESRYLYDPLARRVGRRIWKSQTERQSRHPTNATHTYFR